MSLKRAIGRYYNVSDGPAKCTPDGRISRDDYEGPGSTIRWGSWAERPNGIPITLFPYASGSDYSGSTVEASNYRVLAADGHVAARSVLIQGGHGTFGIAFVGAPTRRIQQILAALNSYPILDESDMSDLEMELEQSQWADHGRADFKREIERAFEIDSDLLTDAILDGTWSSFASDGSGDTHSFESPDSCYFRHDDAIKWLRKARLWECDDCPSALVLGYVPYDERGGLSIARDAHCEGRIVERDRILLGLELAIVPLKTAEDLVRERGLADGARAGSNVDINSYNGARILKGIEDGDPEILDGLPQLQLGQWADDPSFGEILEDIGVEVSDTDTPDKEEMIDDLFAIYSDGWSEGMVHEVERRCRFYLGDS